ncbi:MAG: YjfB family protein [Lachnospiraceae bacterium]|nr:YjfB family protein [Lachnospiraceae bacterium]
MDIAAYAMSNAQTSIMQAVSTEMLSKAMDMMEIQSAQLTQMMELSVNPGLGGNMDIRI